ncbi:trypsin beta-like [Rhynchophorus ferrugineus]|uniref:trypsin beta-like n=1 Tax=Rhynchophorus ferrugineus TaxID=354439 RepID=UPI003FCCBA17
MKLLLFVLGLVTAALAETYLQPQYYPTEPRVFQNASDSLRIVDGWNAVRNQFPYQISLQRLLIFSYFHICGGSIVSPRWVLSAAHCTFGTAASSFRVVAGILLQSDTGTTSLVSQIINHPGYPGGNTVSADDICLIRLTTQLTFGSSIQSIPIAVEGSSARGTAVLSGWGSLGPNNSTSPSNLQYIELPILPQDECAERIASVSGANNPFRPLLNVCTVPRSDNSREGACSGDSGGPLVSGGRLIGVVSWGYTPCGTPRLPSVFAKVGAYNSWIRENSNGEVH